MLEKTMFTTELYDLDIKSAELKITNATHRTRKQQIVLFSGKAGSGKTEAAKHIYKSLYLSYEGLNLVHTSFATPIKEIAYSVFNWDGKKDGKGRRLLQVIGTEAGREYNENIWVQKLEERELSSIFPNHFVLVDDWRYPNEKSYFENKHFYDVTSIRIERKENPYLLEDGMAHLSENAIPASKREELVYNKDNYYNFTIFNDSSLENYYSKLDEVLEYLKTKIVTE